MLYPPAVVTSHTSFVPVGNEPSVTWISWLSRFVTTRAGRWIIWSIRRQIPPGVRTRVSPVTQGLDALIRPDLGQVCHWLIVSSYWTPGSAQRHAAKAIWSHRSRALMLLETLPLVRQVRCHSPSSSNALKKALG